MANSAFAIATLHRPMRGFLNTDAARRQRRSTRANAAARKANAIIAMAKLKARSKRSPKLTAPATCTDLEDSQTEELPPG